MANITVRYFVQKPRPDGFKKFYWQPSKALRLRGWKCQRLTNSYALAIAAAENINRQVDAWRADLAETEGSSKTKRFDYGTVAKTIRTYYRSEEFKAVRPTTKKGYRYCLEQIERWKGDQPIRSITTREIQSFYDRMHRVTPGKARAVFFVLRLLLSFACRQDLNDVNPALNARIKGRVPRAQVWSEEAFETIISTAERMGRPSVGTAVMLALFLGQRQGDVLQLKWSDYSDNAITLRQSKTGKLLKIALVPELTERLAGLPRDHDFIVISETTGRPYTEDAFRQGFQKVRTRAARELPEVAELWFMDLRRTMVVWLGEEEATETQVASVTGHSIDHSRSILETYLPRNAKMAATAIDKISARRARRRTQAARDRAAEAEASGAHNLIRAASLASRDDIVVVPIRFAPANDVPALRHSNQASASDAP